jgi:hypothetical protein
MWLGIHLQTSICIMFFVPLEIAQFVSYVNMGHQIGE